MRTGLQVAVVLIAFGAAAAPSYAREPSPSDDEIRQRLIRDSISAYSGSCPCPYSTARNGSRCGRRSAYDRPGGASPLCYPENVTAEMVAHYRKRRGLTAAR